MDREIENRLAQILDLCLSRMSGGESIGSCLSDYPELQKELAPLLEVAQTISEIPAVSPSDEFVRTAQSRLMAVVRRESAQVQRSRRPS